MAELAQADFERAIELAPERFPAWVGLGQLLHLRAIAAYTRGQDPAPFFVGARQAHHRALELAPDEPTALLNLAWTAYFEGKFALREGSDPTGQLAEAGELCRRSLAGRRRPRSLLCLGSVWRMEAEHHINRNELDLAASHISEAEAILREVLDLDSTHAEAHRSLGRLMTLEARRLRRVGEDPTAMLTQARELIDRALELEVSLIDFYLADARWYLEQAQWLRAARRDFAEVIAEGRRSLAEALDQADGSIEVSRLEVDFEAMITTRPI